MFCIIKYIGIDRLSHNPITQSVCLSVSLSPSLSLFLSLRILVILCKCPDLAWSGYKDRGHGHTDTVMVEAMSILLAESLGLG